MSSFDVLPLVSDTNEDSLTLTSLRDPNFPGFRTDDGAGGFTFDPQGAFGNLLIGQENDQSFDYEVSDGLATTTGTITITAQGTRVPTENISPITFYLDVSTTTDTAVNISVKRLVADQDGDALEFTTLSPLTPLKGILTIIGDGTFIYDPSNEFTALPVSQTETASFDYTVNDGQANDTATVSRVVEGTATGSCGAECV